MIRDVQCMYSDAQSLVQSTGSYDSTNVINQQAAGDAYDPLALRISIGTAVVGAGSSLAVNLLTADDSAFSTNLVTYPIVAATGVASLTAGAVLFNGYLPIGMKQYHKLQYVVSGAAMTAGTVNAALVEDIPTNRM